MNELRNFDFRGNDVRVTVIDNEPYFVGKDVAKAIGYSNANDALGKHVKDKYKRVSRIATPSGTQEMVVISESGMYQFAASSGLPNAEPFQDWLFEIVLPAIRKHGGYLTPNAIEQAAINPEFLRNIADKLDEEQRARELAEGKVKLLEPKALYADMLDVSETSILIGQLAKLLKQKGIEIGEKRLFKFMRDNGYLISGNRSDHNMPTQKSMRLGLFEVKSSPVFHNSGAVGTSYTSKVTAKGQRYFLELFLKQGV